MAMSKIWGYLGCMQMGFSGVFLKSPFPIKTRHHHHLGEFFCTIWLIRQLTNEGWFVSLLPENVSIFRPSFFSISSPSKMSLTSRPNICYYYLGVCIMNKERSSHYYIWEVENSVKNYKGMYYLQFILCIDLKTKSVGITCITLSTMLWGDFSNAILKKPSESV